MCTDHGGRGFEGGGKQSVPGSVLCEALSQTGFWVHKVSHLSGANNIGYEKKHNRRLKMKNWTEAILSRNISVWIWSGQLNFLCSFFNFTEVWMTEFFQGFLCIPGTHISNLTQLVLSLPGIPPCFSPSLLPFLSLQACIS